MMKSMRKASNIVRLSSTIINSNRVISNFRVSTSCQGRRAFTTLLDKEHAEESRYIHLQEEKRQAELRKKLEAVLALEDGHEHKENVIGLLESKAEKSLLAKYGLNNYFLSVPIGLAIFVPLLEKGYIVLNEEIYVLLSFGIFFGTVVTQAGPMISKSFDESIESIRTTFRSVDDAVKQKIIDEKKQAEELVGIDKSYREIHQLVDDLSVAQAEALNASIEHKYRDIVAKKLDTLVSLENAAAVSLRQRALNEVNALVLEQFKSNKAVKEAALTQALTVLSGGPNAKLGKDVVGDVFASAFKSYRESYAKQAPGSDKIIAALEKDIAAVLEEPILEERGGNVYVTHPVTQRFMA